MTVPMPSRQQREGKSTQTSRGYAAPPKNPNKRPTTINMDRSIGRMKANDMDVIRKAR